MLHTNIVSERINLSDGGRKRRSSLRVGRLPYRFSLRVCVFMVFVLTGIMAFAGIGQAETSPLKITVTFNNVPYNPHLKTSWGFSCLVENMGQTILFDTGGDGKILLSNMKYLGVDPTSVSVVFLSHIHADHTAGLENFLHQNPKVTIYMPESFPVSFQQTIKGYGAKVNTVGRPTQLFDQVYSSGEMGEGIKEQALILDTSNGLVIITGCAHPGVVNVVRKAKEWLNKEPYLVMGGFHLGAMSSGQISEIIRRLKQLGVKKVAPSHCTGKEAMALFRQAWGDDFVEGGAGAVIEFSP